MDEEDNERRPDQNIIDEAKALHEAKYYCSDFELYKRIEDHVWKLIDPLIKKKNPDALFLKCMMTTYPDGIEAEEMDRIHRQYLRDAADAGSVEAKFRLACDLDEDRTREEASALFREAAEAGHPYAMWCHGLNLYGGTGQKQNKELGMEYVKKAAENKFEGALWFMNQVYSTGTHGFPKDEQKAAYYLKRLSDKDVINY